MKRVAIGLVLGLMLSMTIGTTVVFAGVEHVYVDPSAHIRDVGHSDDKGGGRPYICIKTPQGKVVPPLKVHGPPPDDGA
ncbi:hypothetical protein ACFLX7_04460 [Chloroflexota bacterium]